MPHAAIDTSLRLRHLGDITWHDGFLFVLLTGPDPTGFTPPAIAVFRGDETLAYVDHIALPQTVSFWIAVDKDGFLYSSDRIPDTKTDVPFTKYQIYGPV